MEFKKEISYLKQRLNYLMQKSKNSKKTLHNGMIEYQKAMYKIMQEYPIPLELLDPVLKYYETLTDLATIDHEINNITFRIKNLTIANCNLAKEPK